MKISTNRKRKRGIRRRQAVRLLKVLAVLLVLVVIAFAAFMKLEYLKRPGMLKAETIKVTERGTNYITLQWEEVRNTDYYELSYRAAGKKGAKWKSVEVESVGAADKKQTDVATATVRKLKMGTKYEFSLQPRNSEKDGLTTDKVAFATRSRQTIRVSRRITKMTSTGRFNLGAKAKTGMTYTSSNKSVATINKTSGLVKLKSAGTTTIRIRAEESQEYIAARATVKLQVLEMSGSSAGVAARIAYTLDESNCSKVLAVTGDGGVHVPQSLAYTGDSYIIAYCNGTGSSQSKIITFDKKGNKLSVVGTSALGHPNGFTYCEETGLCYALRGNSSRVDTYNPKTGAIGSTTMTYGAAGICYDPALKQIYTTSRTGVRTYSGDGSFTHKKLMGNCTHSGHTYTQDSGAYNGLVFRCMSGSNKHGLNYVDIYDTRSSQYMGSFAVYLGEVESAAVNEDGDLLLLVNTSGKTDYIYNTHINVKTMSE